MNFETIDREDVMLLFSNLMHTQNITFRLLRLSGGAKMGKSHLLTKVFPILAKQKYGYHYVTFDLRTKSSILEFLHAAGITLGEKNFPKFQACYQSWINRTSVNVQGIKAVFSQITIGNQEDTWKFMIPEVTTAFVNDLGALTHKPILLLFDSVNDATPDIQIWLMDMLLVRLALLDHIRIVIAGRELPDINGNYAAVTQHIALNNVTTFDPYLAFCQKIKANLTEQSIYDLAQAFDFIPGLFAEIVLSKFVKNSN